MTKGSGKKRTNIYFRQTPKEFRAANQTKVFSHINRNIPYRIFIYTKQKAILVVNKAKKVGKLIMKLPESAKKIR